MAGETLRIDELRLRIPGIAADEANSLGSEVVDRIAGGLALQGRTHHLGALDLRVMLPTGTERDRLAQLIAEAILGRLA